MRLLWESSKRQKKLFPWSCEGLIWYSSFDTGLKSLPKQFRNVNKYNKKFLQLNTLENIWVRLPAGHIECLTLNLYMSNRGAARSGRGDDKSCFILKLNKARYFPGIFDLTHWMTNATTKTFEEHSLFGVN